MARDLSVLENMDRRSREFHVALSFAGEQRAYVREVADALVADGVRVFFDEHQEATLWGKDLFEHLDYVYGRAADYCVVFISKEYAEKIWPNHERRAAQARALDSHGEYILPARFDDTELPGMRGTVHYVDLTNRSPSELASLIQEKIGDARRSNFYPSEPDRLLDELNVADPDEAEHASHHGWTFFRRLQLMTEPERSLVVAVLRTGCPGDLPDNVHVNLDYLRRVTRLGEPAIVETLRGVSSLGFQIVVGSRPDHEPSESFVTLRWSNLSVRDEDPPDDPWEENATEVAHATINVLNQFCDDCAEGAVETMDFSYLSSRLTDTDRIENDEDE
jgi:hypothetical protein